MRIGIFGGSFNPPHNMHEEIARKCIEENYVDEVIFVPTGTKYEYKFNLLENEIRYEMLEKIVSKDSRFSISTFEFQEEIVYTYETLDHFRKKYPNDEIYFICGTDNLSYIEEWRKGEYILENYKILVIERDTNKFEKILSKLSKYQKNMILTNIKPTSISSTEVRKWIQEEKKEELEKCLDKEVLDCILKNQLYKETKE